MTSPIEKIIAVRHGESYEDVDPNIRSTVDDNAIELTKLGIEQAKEVARSIRDELELFDIITLVSSTSRRAEQTTEIIAEELSDPRVQIMTEKSIRNLDWGSTNADNVKEIEQERYQAGVLYYHFPNGDYTPDYVKRIQDFVQVLIESKYEVTESECVVLVCHGFSLRIIVKSLTEMSDEDFKWIKHPPNTFIARIYFDPKKRIFYMPEPLPTRESEIKE